MGSVQKSFYKASLLSINLLWGIIFYSEPNGAGNERPQHSPSASRQQRCPAPGFVFFLSLMELIMSKFTSAVKTFVADENGVTALEYGMIAALIAAVIAGTVKTLGGSIDTAFNTIVSKLAP
jgi:pilus assembly protein Flp/PilA